VQDSDTDTMEDW